QTKQPALRGQLGDVELAQAAKDFRVAEFYRRTNHPGSAFFYYETVRRRYPDTEYAKKAAQRLAELRQKADEARGHEREANAAPPSKSKQTIGGFPVEGNLHFDRKENKAWVSGAGVIRFPTSVSIHGEPLSSPEELTIHWSRDMFFDGRRAIFHGGVE